MTPPLVWGAPVTMSVPTMTTTVTMMVTSSAGMAKTLMASPVPSPLPWVKVRASGARPGVAEL